MPSCAPSAAVQPPSCGRATIALPFQAATQAATQAQLDPVLAELAELIAGSHYNAANRLEAAQQLFIAAGLADALEPLRQALEAYDFETAQTLMEQLGRPAVPQPGQVP